MSAGRKKCRRCNRRRVLSKFGKNNSTWDKLHYYCKDCASLNFYESRDRFIALHGIKAWSERRASYRRPPTLKEKRRQAQWSAESYRRTRVVPPCIKCGTIDRDKGSTRGRWHQFCDECAPRCACGEIIKSSSTRNGVTHYPETCATCGGRKK